jgi:hypothetical protein
MKALAKSQYVKRWLRSGKTLTPNQARALWKADRLAVIVGRMRADGEWIIDIGPKGRYSKYLLFKKGPINNLEINGFRFEILNAKYAGPINAPLSDMEITIKANDGRVWEQFIVNSDAFRNNQIMKKALYDSLNKIEA